MPGFIDLHQHAWDRETYRLKIRDGVTAILELEVGTDDVESWYAEREGQMPLHYGVAVGHIPVRMRVMGDFPSFLPKSDAKAATVEASEEQLEEMMAEIVRGLESGAVAVGFGISYTPADNTNINQPHERPESSLKKKKVLAIKSEHEKI